MKKKKITYIDLFAGAGGLSEGFTESGYYPVAHVEMNEDACKTLATREVFHYLKNQDRIDVYRQYLKGEISREQLYSSVPSDVVGTVIRKTMSKDSMGDLFGEIDKLTSKQKIKTIDLIVGGPPCQAYSLVGRAVKGNAMSSDPRNYLYQLYLEVLEKYKPKMFVFENVPGLLNANKGKYFADMKTAFDKAGYLLDHKILNSHDFGVLQNRQRIILIGWQKKKKYFYPEFKKVYLDNCVSDILYDLPALEPGDSDNHYKTDIINDYLRKTKIRNSEDILTWHISRTNLDRDREIYRNVIKAWDSEKKRLKYTDLPQHLCTHKNRKAFLDRFKVVAGDLPACHTMMAHISKDGHYFIHPDIKQARSLSVREAARVQSFPDNFYFEGSRTAAFTQIGNAVPPLMAKGIAEELKKQLETEDE